MEQKQTAVEWLVEKLADLTFNYIAGFSTKEEYDAQSNQVINQAKEIEKQQIMELKFQTLIAYGVPLEKAIMFSEQYYNKEYGNET